jgi:hypothetical protein
MPQRARAVLALLALLGSVNAAYLLSSFSATNSAIACTPSTVTAGFPVICTATLRDTSNALWGDAENACQLLFTWCGQTANQSAGPLSNHSFVSTGVYKIYFYPTASGWNSLAATANSLSVAVTPSTILINPGPISGYASTATCATTMGITKCTIKHRDIFGNVLSTCSTYTTDSALQPLSTCSVLS